MAEGNDPDSIALSFIPPTAPGPSPTPFAAPSPGGSSPPPAPPPASSPFDPDEVAKGFLISEPPKRLGLPYDNTPDEYAGMGDYMSAPPLSSYLQNPMDFIGLANADKDSIRAIFNKLSPDTKITDHKGNLVMENPDGQKFVYRGQGHIQTGDIIRAATGMPFYLGAETLGGLAGALGGPTSSMAGSYAGTALATHLLAMARQRAGGAPPSYLEDALAPATRGLIHGIGKTVGALGGAVADRVLSRERVAPGLEGLVPVAPGGPRVAIDTGLHELPGIAVPPEGPALQQPGEHALQQQPPAGSIALTPANSRMPPMPVDPNGVSIGDLNDHPAPVAPVRPEAPLTPMPPKYAPDDPTAGLVPLRPPTPPAVQPPGLSPALQEIQDKANQVLKGIVKELDKSKVNADVLRQRVYEVDRLGKGAAAGYATVDDAMKGAKVNPGPLLDFVDGLEKEGKIVPGWLKAIRRNLTSEEGATYGGVDQARKTAGAILENLKGPNPNPKLNQSIAKGVWKAASTAQAAALEAKNPALLGSYQAAQAAKRLQFAAKKKITELFGRQIGKIYEGDMNLAPALHSLSDGASSEINKLSRALPDTSRADAFMSAIGGMFGDVAADEPVDLGKYGEWFNRVRNKTVAASDLQKAVGPENMQGLRDLNGLSEQFKAVTSSEAQQAFAAAQEQRAAQAAHTEATAAYNAAVNEASEKLAKVSAARAADRARIGKLRQMEISGSYRPDRAAAAEATKAANARTQQLLNDYHRASESLARLKTAMQASKEAAGAARKAASDATARNTAVWGAVRRLAGLPVYALSHYGGYPGMKAAGAMGAYTLVNEVAPLLASTEIAKRIGARYAMPTPKLVSFITRSLELSMAGAMSRKGAVEPIPQARAQ